MQTRHLNLFGAVRGHKQCIHEIPLEHLQPVPAFLRSAREGAMYESSVPENDTVPLHRIEYKHTALELHGMTGTLICFDYQEEALREICGQCVMLQSIDFQQFERSVLYS